MAVQVKDAIVAQGRVVRGWLGMTTQDLSYDVAKMLKLPPKSGVLVADVNPDSPAQVAGIRAGDAITDVDGTSTNDTARLRYVVAIAGRGKKVRIGFLREGRADTTVHLGCASRRACIECMP